MNEAALDTSARVKRIPAPIASPGCCGLCGKVSHDRGFASTDNFDFEFYGTLYFCYDCVGDYARTFGYMSREEVTNLLEELKSQRAELDVLRESVVNLESILDAYSNLRPNSGLPDYRDTGAVIPAVDVSEGTSQDSNPLAGIIDNREGTDEPTDEPVSEPRSDDVRNSTSELDDLINGI